MPCSLIRPSNYLIQMTSIPAYIYQVNLPIAVKYTHIQYKSDDFDHLPKLTRLSFCLIPGLGWDKTKVVLDVSSRLGMPMSDICSLQALLQLPAPSVNGLFWWSLLHSRKQFSASAPVSLDLSENPGSRLGLLPQRILGHLGTRIIYFRKPGFLQLPIHGDF